MKAKLVFAILVVGLLTAFSDQPMSKHTVPNVREVAEQEEQQKPLKDSIKTRLDTFRVYNSKLSEEVQKAEQSVAKLERLVAAAKKQGIIIDRLLAEHKHDSARLSVYGLREFEPKDEIQAGKPQPVQPTEADRRQTDRNFWDRLFNRHRP